MGLGWVAKGEQVWQVLGVLIELGAASMIGADRLNRTDERLGYSNGYLRRNLKLRWGASIF